MMVSQPGPCPAVKLATVVGNSSSDEAKIGGMTPEVLSLSGRCEDWPSNMRLPTWRLGYWISSRRCARSMNTMKVMTATAITSTMRMSPVESAPWRPSSSVPAIADGNCATMPDMMISEVPLPMPRWVICSPSHIRNMVPPVSVITVEMRKNMPGVGDHASWRLQARPRCHRPGTPPAPP